MVSRFLTTFTALSIVFAIATTSQAIELHKDGRSIETHWKQKRKELRVWGAVQKGRDCKQLNLSIFLRNSSDARISHIETTISPYRSHTRNTFKGTDTVYAKKRDRKNWHIDEIYTNCLN